MLLSEKFHAYVNGLAYQSPNIRVIIHQNSRTQLPAILRASNDFNSLTVGVSGYSHLFCSLTTLIWFFNARTAYYNNAKPGKLS